MSASSFHPDWLPDQRKAFGRWGAGLALDCPTHIGCRVEIWFLNPVDGSPPFPRPQLYYRTGLGLGDIGVVGTVDLGAHGCFELIAGQIVMPLQ